METETEEVYLMDINSEISLAKTEIETLEDERIHLSTVINQLSPTQEQIDRAKIVENELNSRRRKLEKLETELSKFEPR